MKALGAGLLCGGYAKEELERAGAHLVYDDNHGGTRPPCKGKSANPDRFIATILLPKIKSVFPPLGTSKTLQAPKQSS